MVGRQLTPYQETIRVLSEHIVNAQRPIRLLDAIKWGPEVKQKFFADKFKKLPAVDADYYAKNPLPFDPIAKNEEFYAIELAVRKHLGQFSPIGHIMQRICREYRELVRMMQARGGAEFAKFSQELYGSSEDVFYAGGPSLKDLSDLVTGTLENISNGRLKRQEDEKIYTSEEAVEFLQGKMSAYFAGAMRNIQVKLGDGIIADASAGADAIKIRRGAKFSERELRLFEVHEGWVHVATTLNGLQQPICTFLGKGPPSATITQEGLAIILEIL